MTDTLNTSRDDSRQSLLRAVLDLMPDGGFSIEWTVRDGEQTTSTVIAVPPRDAEERETIEVDLGEFALNPGIRLVDLGQSKVLDAVKDHVKVHRKDPDDAT